MGHHPPVVQPGQGAGGFPLPDGSVAAKLPQNGTAARLGLVSVDP
jgi:hypothetical protein